MNLRNRPHYERSLLLKQGRDYIKLVQPDFAEQIEIQLIQLAQSGRVNLPINDNQLKELLTRIQSQQTKRDITIRRK
jgi:programmed cell death protein 5